MDICHAALARGFSKHIDVAVTSKFMGKNGRLIYRLHRASLNRSTEAELPAMSISIQCGKDSVSQCRKTQPGWVLCRS
ncbi:hypothetical protein F0562_022217 [Nyssa sinensis]|uniref:Uncharacterized protein n=1 Tax=Nyssa sinensis TaxID=561372 RepID=A0A5J5BQU3_9ASTE|nr:hypothetical protein F0562_022217 [Nyssa sinensis]